MNKLSLLLFLVICSCVSVISQMLYNPNDERFKSLYLEKVESDYTLQKEEFNRQRTLNEKQLISQREFNESEARFRTARITYQQAILSLAFEQPHIMIESAIKYQGADGKKRVKLTFRNTTGGFTAGKKIDLTDFEGLRTDQISNVYVSLLNDQKGIISQPYEAKITSMPYNRPVSVDFLLLQDLDNVTVKTVYAETSEEKKILLQRGTGAANVLITPKQFSQEADLGSSAVYALTFEPYSVMDRAYRLAALNLPRQITYDFIEAQTNARISQIQFSQDISTRNISLIIYLPEQYDSSSFVIDRPVVFFAVAIPESQSDEWAKDDRRYAVNELQRLNVGYVQLEVIPRGIARLEMRATNFYHELKPGEKAEVKLTVSNDGTRALNKIKVFASVPVEWVAITPEPIDLLAPGRSWNVLLTLVAPENVNVGDYEATVKTEAFSSNRKIESEGKKLHLHVLAASNMFMKTILIILLCSGLVGLIVF